MLCWKSSKDIPPCSTDISCHINIYIYIYIYKELRNKHNSISYKDLRLNNLMKLTPEMVKLFSPIKWKEEGTLLRDHTRILGPLMSRC